MPKSIRIALSGSGYKFPAHVGALLAVRDAGFKPVEYAGTSGGSIVATLAASGMDLDAMRTLVLTHDWSGMLTWNFLAMFSGGYCDGKTLRSWLLTNTNNKKFSDLSVDLTVVSTDVVTEAPFIFSKKLTADVLVGDAARASASIPFVYSPVQLNGAMLMDGGMEDNIPADLLTIDDLPRLGVQLTSKATPFPPGDTSLKSLAPRLLDLILSATEAAHEAIAQKSGVKFATIETGYAGCLDGNMPAAIRHRLMDDGYEATAAALKHL